jgi:hypothetical protein
MNRVTTIQLEVPLEEGEEVSDVIVRVTVPKRGAGVEYYWTAIPFGPTAGSGVAQDATRRRSCRNLQARAIPTPKLPVES